MKLELLYILKTDIYYTQYISRWNVCTWNYYLRNQKKTGPARVYFQRTFFPLLHVTICLAVHKILSVSLLMSNFQQVTQCYGSFYQCVSQEYPRNLTENLYQILSQDDIFLGIMFHLRCCQDYILFPVFSKYQSYTWAFLKVTAVSHGNLFLDLVTTMQRKIHVCWHM